MKKLFFYLSILFVTITFGQNNTPNLAGEFEISSIETVGKYYLVKAVNNKGDKVLIMEKKPKGKVCRKNKKNPNIKEIEIGQTYSFDLQSESFDIGFTETGKIVIGKKEIWDRETSDFDVYQTADLQGLYYVAQ